MKKERANFWQMLERPIVALAPMEGVTDTVFRRVVAKAAPPSVFFTEFTSVEGMASEVGSESVERRLIYTEEERPIVAQIWGINPHNFEKAAERIVEMGFDGVDINMGCPDKAVVKMGSGSALVKDKPLAAEIISAVKRGVAGRIPVSVKIRIGYKEVETEDWARFLLEQGIDVLTIHGRTTKQMSKVPADWEEIAKVVNVRNNLGVHTLVLGNGDVFSARSQDTLVGTSGFVVKNANGIWQDPMEFGVDGIMIGRGVFVDPWVFELYEAIHGREERLDLLLYHLDLWEQQWSSKDEYPYIKHYDILKKFFKIYISHFEGAKELRMRLMETHLVDEAREIVMSSHR